MITGSDIALKAQLGGGLLLPHPNGVVIHLNAKIGINCVIYQQVTIGTKADGEDIVPVIGDNVTILPGAILLGPIHVGANAVIGANTVVLADVPERDNVVPITTRRIR